MTLAGVGGPRDQLLVARTRTGDIVDALDDPSWTCDAALAWGDSDKANLSVPLPGIGPEAAVKRASLRGLANAMSGATAVVVRDGTAIWAGPVVTLGWDSAGVTIGAAGPKWIFDRRMVMNPTYLADPTNPGADVSWTYVPVDQVPAILGLALSGPGRSLPITLPGLGTNTAEPTIYRGMDLRTASEAVKELVEADGGPDVLIQPTISADMGSLSWSVTVGALGGLNTEAVWDYPLMAVSGELDDSETVSTAFVPGEAVTSTSGGEGTRLIGVSSVTRGPDRIPLERADRTSASQTRPDILARLATSYQGAYDSAVEEITLEAPTDYGPQYRRQYNLGDVIGVDIQGHPWLDPMFVQRRFVAVRLTRSSTQLTTTGGRLT